MVKNLVEKVIEEVAQSLTPCGLIKDEPTPHLDEYLKSIPLPIEGKVEDAWIDKGKLHIIIIPPKMVDVTRISFGDV